MKIKIEPSGGLAGFSSSSELDGDKLPTSLEDTVRKLLEGKKTDMIKHTRPKGAADYLNYKITIQDGKKNHVVECSEFEIDRDLKALINYIQNNSMGKKNNRARKE